MVDDYEFEPLQESDVEDLEQRVSQLESQIQASPKGREAGGVLGYTMGMSLAMILSWAKNGSILWCIIHGMLSWIYVIYFAIVR